MNSCKLREREQAKGLICLNQKVLNLGRMVLLPHSTNGHRGSGVKIGSKAGRNGWVEELGKPHRFFLLEKIGIP